MDTYIPVSQPASQPVSQSVAARDEGVMATGWLTVLL